MKKSIKIVSVILLLIILIMPCMVLANPIDDIKPTPPDGGMEELDSFRNKIYTVFTTVGTGIAVIGLLLLAIKYISSSPNDRAEIKKFAIIYIVGATLFFGAVGIVEILKGFGLEVFK